MCGATGIIFLRITTTKLDKRKSDLMTRIVSCISRGSVSVAQRIGGWVCPRSRLDTSEELQVFFLAKNRIRTVRPVASDCNDMVARWMNILLN